MHANRVRETSATTGTGSFNLAGAPSGYRSFVQAFGGGAKVFYVAVFGAQWEIGIGTLTAGSPDVLSRDVIIQTSAGTTSPVNFSAGTKTIFNTLPASLLAIPRDAIDTTSGQINNYNPLGYGCVEFTAATILTGISGGYDGRVLFITNKNAASALKLANESAASSVGNYIRTGTNSDEFIPIHGSAILKYEQNGNIWVVQSISPGTRGLIDAKLRFHLSGIISPPQITADQNDYNPTGGAEAPVWRLTSDASRNVTGIATGSWVASRVHLLLNVASNPIVLKNEDVGSTAANRFAFGSDITLAAGGPGIWIWYDSTSSRWRVVGAGAAAGGGIATISRTIFTANGTWNKPANLKYAIVEVWGAGGSGGGSNTGANGCGGAGGGYSRKLIAAASLGATETVTIGAGGAAIAANTNTNGNAGGTSSFGAHCSATGGGGGVNGNGGGGGDSTPGSGSGGDLNVGGGPGYKRYQQVAGVDFGNGGAGALGGAISAPYNAGNAPAGGGGGGNNGGASGAGAAGLVIVTEYVG